MTGPTVPRRLDLASDLRNRSVFLFGPRQTGKTTYLKALFPRSPVFNLLRGEVFLRLSREPGRLRQELATVARSRAPIEDLRAYCGSYLQLEIQAEGLVRGVERFSRFLTAAALGCGQQVVYERLASDAAVPARTVREYFQVLEDTLVGELVRPFTPKRASRKPVSHAKFYLFDVGVANVLAGITRIEAGSAAFGRALEHLVYCELSARLGYTRDTRPLTFWRTADGSEVDFVVGDSVAIEVKASGAVIPRDLTGLRRLAEDGREPPAFG